MGVEGSTIKKPYTAEDILALRAEGKTYPQIATKLGAESADYLRAVVSRFKRKKNRGGPILSRWQREREALTAELNMPGMTVEKLAEKYLTTVPNLLKRLRLKASDIVREVLPKPVALPVTGNRKMGWKEDYDSRLQHAEELLRS